MCITDTSQEDLLEDSYINRKNVFVVGYNYIVVCFMHE